MNFDIFRMPLSDIGLYFVAGLACGAVYMYLLWETVSLLPRVKHFRTFLFLSKVLRIFLILTVMVILSGHHAGRFLTLFCGLVTARILTVRLTRVEKSVRTEQIKLEPMPHRARKGKRRK